MNNVKIRVNQSFERRPNFSQDSHLALHAGSALESTRDREIVQYLIKLWAYTHWPFCIQWWMAFRLPE